jgi:hypothetical protein
MQLSLEIFISFVGSVRIICWLAIFSREVINELLEEHLHLLILHHLRWKVGVIHHWIVHVNHASVWKHHLWLLVVVRIHHIWTHHRGCSALENISTSIENIILISVRLREHVILLRKHVLPLSHRLGKYVLLLVLNWLVEHIILVAVGLLLEHIVGLWLGEDIVVILGVLLCR